MIRKVFLLACFLVLGCLPPVVAAEDCPVAGIVVGSVLGTLAVCCVVVGIIGFLLWRRRKGLTKTPHIPLKSDHEVDTPTKGAFDNPAFDQGEGRPDLVAAEAGAVGYVPNKEFLAKDKQKSPFRAQMDKELAKKTWSSLPKSDLPTINRSGSIGSLDRNVNTGEPEYVFVDLQSQDFIGLGFNIAGSMRDGIYVSQVHNRGPAVESGKFKVGDRIMSVTISFENMVYEDALTILSYASPYPVKVCLQKQEQIPKNRRLSDSKINLNHPLYRSQSVDTLIKIGKEPNFYPKRSLSEMRHDKKESPDLKRFKNGLDRESVVEETLQAKQQDDVFCSENLTAGKDVSPRMNPMVMVHKVDSAAKTKLNFDEEISDTSDHSNGMPNATVDLNNVEEVLPDDSMKDKPMVGIDMLDNTQPKVHNFSAEFDTLTEQDKLDMIRLSYVDPDEADAKKSQVVVPQQAVEVEINPTLVNGDLRAAPAPTKPERKKKRSSAASTPSQSDGEFPGSAPSSPKASNDVDTDVAEELVFTLAPPVHAPPPPPVNDSDNEAEAEEDAIAPASNVRVVDFGNDKIVFTPVDLKRGQTKDDMADDKDGAAADSSLLSADLSTTLVDHSFSDMDNTLVAVSPSSERPPSPDEDAIDEDEIAPTQIKKEKFEIPATLTVDKQPASEPIKNGTRSSSSSSSSSNSDDDSEKVPEPVKAEVKTTAKEPESEEDFGKDLPSLDMNLNFESDSVLFKETFPSRNTKEKDGGVAYDISVTELHSMENKIRQEQLTKQNENQTPKGGIAFEIRDDVLTGVPQTVTTSSVHRTSSYDMRTTNEFPINDKLSQRTASFKEDSKSGVGSSTLDWSGQRLVRSGSFTDILQDDATKDWTNDSNLNEDDVIMEQHLQEDLQSPEMKKLTKATLFKARENLADLSDSDQCRSISTSSSASNSPTREFTNGQDDGLGTSPETSPIKITPTSESKTELISTVTKYGDNDQAFTVTLQASGDDDADC